VDLLDLNQDDLLSMEVREGVEAAFPNLLWWCSSCCCCCCWPLLLLLLLLRLPLLLLLLLLLVVVLLQLLLLLTSTFAADICAFDAAVCLLLLQVEPCSARKVRLHSMFGSSDVYSVV
jgi:hypothetical protein